MVSVAALTALVAGPAVVNAQRPQRSWSPELGVQGGFSRFKASGTGRADQADFFDVPGFTLVPLVPASGATALYAIIPVHGKLALEPSFATSQLEGGTGNGLTLVTAGLRGDYALTRKVYAAVGATLGFVETAGQHETQLGVEAAVGYRLHLAGRLNGRLEANWQSTKNAKLLPPWNTYSVLFGISSRVTSGAADLSSPAAQARRRAPTLYVIVPVSTRLALEPGVDFHRTQFTNITVFSSNLAGRLDYAVSGGWYAGAGVNLHFIKATKGTFTDTSKTALSVPGANLGWGYRFHLSGELAGRVEINYTMFKQNSDLSQATNTVGLMVGAAMPLN